MPAHAHTMVAGWLMSSVFAFFYHLVPGRARNSMLAQVVHFWLTAVSGIGLLIGLYFLLGGNPAVEPLVAACASIGFYRRDRALRVYCAAARSGAANQLAQPAGSRRTYENFSLILCGR